MSINSVTLTGNLTRDPEVRATTGGTSILNFGIAVNDRRKNPQTGNWEDYPNFIDCVVFGKRADSLANILAKGMKVAVFGKLRYSSWEKDGQRRSKIEVVVDEIDIMSQRKDGNQQPQQQSQQQLQQQMQQQPYQQQWYQQPGNQGYQGQAQGNYGYYDSDQPF